MKIFALLCCSLFSLVAFAGEEAQAKKANEIIDKLFVQMKTPSPVTPPLAPVIEKELEKRDQNWSFVSKKGKKSKPAPSN